VRRLAAAAIGVIFAGHALLAQTTLKPAAPGTAGDPAWQGVVRMSDGRRFVTDGGLAVDVAVARPAKLPDRELPGKTLESYLAASSPVEFGFGDLVVAPTGHTYTAPQGIPLNATYINYLRRILPSRDVRFRMSGALQPVVVLAGGKAVAVLMPVRR